MNYKNRLGWVSVYRTTILTGHTNLKEIAESIGITTDLEEFTYIPQKDAPFKKDGLKWWYDMKLLKEEHFFAFDFEEFLLGAKVYIPKEVYGAPVFLLNERFHLTIVFSPVVEEVEE